jgi:hypothetical protein
MRKLIYPDIQNGQIGWDPDRLQDEISRDQLSGQVHQDLHQGKRPAGSGVDHFLTDKIPTPGI